MKSINLNFFKLHFWKKVVFITLFFLITPITILACSFTLIAISPPDSKAAGTAMTQKSVLGTFSGAQIFASLPDIFPSVSGEIIEEDARQQLIRDYLEIYESPLTAYADYIVETADKYQIDYRLITAIAQQESNLCKYIPPESYNCWGWGIHHKGTLHFSSFEEGIDVVSKGLKENYIDKGYSNPDEIMKKYTPSSPGSWAAGVNIFMDQMK